MSEFDYDPEFDLDGDGKIDVDELDIEMETLFDDDDDFLGNNGSNVNYQKSNYTKPGSLGSRNLSGIESFICVVGGLIGAAAVMAALGLEEFPVILILILWFGFSLVIAWILSKF